MNIKKHIFRYFQAILKYLKASSLYGFRVSGAVIVSMLMIRLAEMVQMVWLKPITQGMLKPELLGILSDLAVFSRVGVVLFAIVLIFGWCKAIYKTLLHLVGVSYVFMELAATFYFLTALVPLDHTMFTYSIGELVTTVKASALGVDALLFILIPIIIYLVTFVFFKRIQNHAWLMLILILAGAIIFMPMRKLRRSNLLAMHEYGMTSKAGYFIEHSIKYCKTIGFSHKNIENPILEEEEIKRFIRYRNEDGFYLRASNGEIAEIDPNQEPDMMTYPLLHKNTYDPLGEYFKDFTTKPNIVIIIMESMGGKAFFPSHPSLSFTPFLDSLKNESLYWPDCFSGSGRTFGVLPTILGSLPYGGTGFCDQSVLASHLSIPLLLKKNGYHSFFFYAGWTGFQNMDALLAKEEVSYLNTAFPNNPNYVQRAKARGILWAWGNPDGELFDRSIEVLDSLSLFPMLNIYLSVSSHGPFCIPNQQKYIDEINKMVTKVDAETKSFIQSNIDPYTSILYADEAVGNLFTEYKRKGWYDNTIFIITGDHCMHELGRDNNLQMFHVPLIIHSPLLKKTKSIKANVSHHDIAPSLLNLMKGKKIIEIPSIVSWLNYGLEMNETNPKKVITFIPDYKIIEQYVYGNYYLMQDELFTIIDGQTIKPCSNEAMRKEMMERLDNFRKIDAYTVKGNKITPLRSLRGYETHAIPIWGYRKHNRISIQKGKNKEFGELVLDDTYQALQFEYRFAMDYEEATASPNIGIDIFDEQGEYVDYFWFRNQDYDDAHATPQKNRSFHMTRIIINQNHIFDKGNKLVFYIRDVPKHIDIRDMSISVFGRGLDTK